MYVENVAGVHLSGAARQQGQQIPTHTAAASRATLTNVFCVNTCWTVLDTLVQTVDPAVTVINQALLLLLPLLLLLLILGDARLRAPRFFPAVVPLTLCAPITVKIESNQRALVTPI